MVLHEILPSIDEWRVDVEFDALDPEAIATVSITSRIMSAELADVTTVDGRKLHAVVMKLEGDVGNVSLPFAEVVRTMSDPESGGATFVVPGGVISFRHVSCPREPVFELA